MGEKMDPWKGEIFLIFFLYKAKICVQYINRYTVYLWYLKYCVIKEKMSKRLLRGR